MRMMMAVNPKGGGIIELMEHKSRPITPPPQEEGYGCYGILEVGYRVRNIDHVVTDFEAKGIPFLTSVCELPLKDGHRWRYAYLKDPDGLPLQLTEDLAPGSRPAQKAAVFGANQVGIGVSNIDRSKEFYRFALGFDRILYEFEGTLPEMEKVAGRPLEARMVILERSMEPSGAMAKILPRGIVKLFEVKDRKGKHLYDGRFWGDPGCMEVCLDVSNLPATVEDMKKRGIEIYLPPIEINMGSGSKGLVAYIRDPDGTTVEFVEIKTVAWLSAAAFARVALPLLRLYDRLG